MSGKLPAFFLCPGILFACSALLCDICMTGCFSFKSAQMSQRCYPGPPHLKFPLSLCSGPLSHNATFIFPTSSSNTLIIYFFMFALHFLSCFAGMLAPCGHGFGILYHVFHRLTCTSICYIVDDQCMFLKYMNNAYKMLIIVPGM